MGAFSFLGRYHSPSARGKEEGLVAAQRKNRGVFLILAAALIWGWNGPAMKGLYISGIALPTLLFLRTLICVVMSGIFFLFFNRFVFCLSPRQFLFLFFMARL